MKFKDHRSPLIGVISDTHGTLPSAALEALQKVDLILHAGDIDRPEVLQALEEIAPVVAVRGNMDRGPWAQRLSPIEMVQAGDATIVVVHDRYTLDLDPLAGGFQAVVYGHSHRPALRQDNGVLFLNPGSASHPRFGTHPGVAHIRVDGKTLQAELIELVE